MIKKEKKERKNKRGSRSFEACSLDWITNYKLNCEKMCNTQYAYSYSKESQ